MRYVVLGGGTAGVCCAEELCKLCPQDDIVLVSSDRTLKGVGNVVKYTDNLEDFEIVERDLTSLPYPNLKVLQGLATDLLTQEQQVLLEAGQRLPYDKLCICTGASPKAVAQNPHVLVLRDQDSIQDLAERLPGLRRIVLVGNGGIALEVAHALSGVEVVWAVKHSHIGDAFFDLDAAAFLCSQIPNSGPPTSAHKPTRKRSEDKGRGQPAATPLHPQTTPDASARLSVQQPESKTDWAANRAGDASHSATRHLQPDSSPGTWESEFSPDAHRLKSSSHGACSDAQTSQGSDSSGLALRQQQDGNEQHLQATETHKSAGRQHKDDRMPQLPQRSRHQRRQSSSLRRSDHSTQQGADVGKTHAGSNCQEVASGGSADTAHGGKSRSSVKGQQGLMRFGHAVGPQWASQLPHSSDASRVTLEYDVEITSIQSQTPQSGTAAQAQAQAQSQQPAAEVSNQQSIGSSWSGKAQALVQTTAARPSEISSCGNIIADAAEPRGSPAQHGVVNEPGKAACSAAEDTTAGRHAAHRQGTASRGGVTFSAAEDSTAGHHTLHRQGNASQGETTSNTAEDTTAEHHAAHRQGNASQDDSRWPVTVCLSNGRSYGADLVISAIGVEPNTGWLPGEITRDAKDGGICVDRLMQSSVPGVHAAGDACTMAWTDMSPHWFQMRLWTQARIQGMFAAHAMAGVTDEMAFGFNFELFTHITRFCGRKVVLLGSYNGQGLEHEPEEDMVTYSRTTEGLNPAFVRVLLLRGRMQGAVLVGETELEETFEHLILDGLDLSRYGPDLLAPDVELEMIFD